MEPLGRLLPQLLSDNGQILLADPSERTRHNRHLSCSIPACMAPYQSRTMFASLLHVQHQLFILQYAKLYPAQASILCLEQRWALFSGQ